MNPETNHFGLKRIPPFKEWEAEKFLVVHMATPMLDVESCLALAQIPFISIAYDSESIETDIRNNIRNSFGIIITGSRKVNKVLPNLPKAILESRLPKLGFCYGHEVLGTYLGANLIECNPPVGERSEVEAVLYPSVLFEGLDLDVKYMVNMAHDYMLETVPAGSKLIAKTHLTPIAGFENLENKTFGLQFHPEKDWMGDIVFRNFYKFCKDS
jgi:GMP synthase-like glutamine amidotransferase